MLLRRLHLDHPIFLENRGDLVVRLPCRSGVPRLPPAMAARDLVDHRVHLDVALLIPSRCRMVDDPILVEIDEHRCTRPALIAGLEELVVLAPVHEQHGEEGASRHGPEVAHVLAVLVCVQVLRHRADKEPLRNLRRVRDVLAEHPVEDGLEDEELHLQREPDGHLLHLVVGELRQPARRDRRDLDDLADPVQLGLDDGTCERSTLGVSDHDRLANAALPDVAVVQGLEGDDHLLLDAAVAASLDIAGVVALELMIGTRRPEPLDDDYAVRDRPGLLEHADEGLGTAVEGTADQHQRRGLVAEAIGSRLGPASQQQRHVVLLVATREGETESRHAVRNGIHAEMSNPGPRVCGLLGWHTLAF